MEHHSIRKTLLNKTFTEDFITKPPASTKNKTANHFYIPKTIGRPLSNMSSFKRTFKKTDNKTGEYQSPGKDIEYFRDILNYSKGLIKAYNKDKFRLKLNKTVKSFSIEPNDYTENISPVRENYINFNSTQRLKEQSSKFRLVKNTDKIINYLDLDNYYNKLERDETKYSTYKTLHTFKEKGTLSKDQSEKSFNQVIRQKTQKRTNNIALNDLIRKEISTNYTNTSLKSNMNFSSYEQTKENSEYPKITSRRKSTKLILKDTNELRTNAFSLPMKGTQYSMPNSFREVHLKLTNEVKDILTSANKNYNSNNSYQFIPKNLTNYASDLISKIKIVNEFLDHQNKKNFKPSQQRHKIVYVILDGSVIFTKHYIKGYYIEIPSRRFLSFLPTKKDRLKNFYDFLAQCQKEFNLQTQLKNVFLSNGIPIFDLIDIPEKDRFVFVSSNTLFQGIHLFNGDNITKKEAKLIDTINDNDMKLLYFKPASKERKIKFDFGGFLRNKKKKKKQPEQIKIKTFKTIKKKKKYLNEQSFTFGVTSNEEEEEYIYYSDNETKKRKIDTYFNLHYPSKISKLVMLNDYHLHNSVAELINNRNKEIKKYYSKRPNENTKEGICKLIKAYNNMRGRKYKINVDHKLNKERTVAKELRDNATTMMKYFIEKMKIFRNYKDTNKDLDINAFYGLNLEQKKKTSYVQKNIWNTHNILYYSDYKTEKFYPDLISFNIPHYLESFPKLKRREFYEIFIEYKTLLKICVTINKNIKLVKEGIDFTTFFSCNPQMNSQGKDLALKIFNSINTLNSKYINWEEYINGLLTIKSRELNDKLDLFLKIIDSDGNGNLSFDEVYSLSIESLTRTLDKSKGNEDDEVVMVLADYFAKLIFQLVGTPIDQEIPIEVIKQKICEGGKAAGYLEMFICADNFT